MVSTSPEVPHLLARARNGEPDALGRLLERYRGYLAILARVQIGRRLQRKVEENDLVQETFLEAHRAFGRFRGSTEPELAPRRRDERLAELTVAASARFEAGDLERAAEAYGALLREFPEDALATAMLAECRARERAAATES